MKNVYLVSKANDSTRVQLLSLEDAESTLPKELGVRLSSLFMFDRLVFVEGPSDEAIVREWAATLGENLNQANVGFINIGGVRNFTHYATESVFSFLTKRQVECWFILDRDERAEAEIQALKDRLGEKARVLILEKRQIENFLLSNFAIERFIRLKQSLSDVKQPLEPNQQSVATAMAECAESLKQRVIDKRVAHILCGSVHPQIDWNQEPNPPITERVSNTLGRMQQHLHDAEHNSARVIEEQTRFVEQNWTQQKLDFVPGDILLDCICQRFGVRFKKGSDGPRLAALMQKHEIDTKIRELIGEMAHG